jgi:transcriptional regulator NrdR family protein
LAFAKTDFTNEEIENLLNTLEIKWQSEWTEIPSSLIWDAVLELSKKDYPAPFVRFSSVYKSFDSLDDFKQLIW